MGGAGGRAAGGVCQPAADSGARGKRLPAAQAEKIERNVAHQFPSGGLRRLTVRGRGNVHKKLLLQAMACNLALLVRALYGAGKPKAAAERAVELFLALFVLLTGLLHR